VFIPVADNAQIVPAFHVAFLISPAIGFGQVALYLSHLSDRCLNPISTEITVDFVLHLNPLIDGLVWEISLQVKPNPQVAVKLEYASRTLVFLRHTALGFQTIDPIIQIPKPGHLIRLIPV
jgi:hypothetical protein